MSEAGTMALDYLFGDRSVFAWEKELSAFVRQLDEKLRTVTADPRPTGGEG